jgi:hypothetical protein
METLLLVIVLFAVHLAVLFSIALIISGLTSLVAIAGFGGRTALQKRDEDGKIERSRFAGALGVFGVLGAALTAVTLGVPLFFGEHFVGPYLDGLHEQGGPAVDIEDASLNIAGGKMRSDGLRLRQDDGAYIYDIGVETVEAEISPIAAMGGTPRIQSLSVRGVEGWLAPGYGGEPVTSATDEPRAFMLGELVLDDIEVSWRPEYDADAVGSLTIDTWRTTNIDHEYTLLDLLGRTNATGSFLDGRLNIAHTGQDTGHVSRWTLDEMSLEKAGAAIGGPMEFVREGTFSLNGRSEWDETLEKPATFGFYAQLDAVNFGPKKGDESTKGKLMDAISNAVANSIPEGSRSLSFSFDFEISASTLQNAKSLYEFDVWKEIESQLKQVILEEVGLAD